MTQTKHLNELHAEHSEWTQNVKFYASDLEVHKTRLGEIGEKNTAKEVREEIEHFQNQFIIHEDKLSRLAHEIKIHEEWLTSYAQQHPVAIDHVRFADHKIMRENEKTFGELYRALKNEFREFVSRHL